MVSLAKLEVLHAENNFLSELPKKLGRMEALKRIYLQDNRLPKLVAGLGHWQVA